MKRRKFLSNIGLAVPGVVVGSSQTNSVEDETSYSYGKISSLKQAVTKEGLVNIRLECMAGTGIPKLPVKGKITVSKGVVNRIQNYFFGESEKLDGQEFKLAPGHHKSTILAIWIEDAVQETIVKIKLNRHKWSFSLEQLVAEQELTAEYGDLRARVNFLLDREIAEITPQSFGLSAPGDVFDMAVMADPQGGDPQVEGNVVTRVKIHNAWIEESVRQTNLLNPVVTLILGDVVDSQGEAGNFTQMAKFFNKLDSPILYAVGNHETRYKSVFTPGYNMEAFNNFFAAQKKVNGLELMLYSFNLGQWHFIVWPDPLRDRFWETHPHYFDWLQHDLDKYKDKPTVFFHHVPVHPVGINPLIDYAEPVDIKRTLLEILARYGNVKYVFSGHVHIPIKASFKTAVRYKGMTLINLPPAGYRHRAFGEEDFQGGPNQGVLALRFSGKSCEIKFRTVMGEEYVYHENIPEFNQALYGLWLRHKWELPVSDTVRNGDFKEGLAYWTPRYVYQEDQNPSNICEVRHEDGDPALYLFTRKRGYDTPGQDRLPQDINRICQAVQLKPTGYPVIAFRYKVDPDSDIEGWCGAYLWLEGFRRNIKMLDLTYNLGTAFTGVGGRYDRSEYVQNTFIGLDHRSGAWLQAVLSPAGDHDSYGENKYTTLGLDRMVLNIGVWTINDAAEFPFGIYVNDITLDYRDSPDTSTVDGRKIQKLAEDKIWWRGKYLPYTHVAGEHRYILATQYMGP